ncbi:hypothetical protein DICVIV_04302 [Dictyocaulus viviparus]|uniref:Uncharacterized protein n=1 Tax=Dictyocaulus viviparus TaxID=29172 RepID=A0A0D8XYJ7_DICVI|nr:hypothetical protein DICVIV_04302 [Dictyocaulus viviparus]
MVSLSGQRQQGHIYTNERWCRCKVCRDKTLDDMLVGVNSRNLLWLVEFNSLLMLHNMTPEFLPEDFLRIRLQSTTSTPKMYKCKPCSAYECQTYDNNRVSATRRRSIGRQRKTRKISPLNASKQHIFENHEKSIRFDDLKNKYDGDNITVKDHRDSYHRNRTKILSSREEILGQSTNWDFFNISGVGKEMIHQEDDNVYIEFLRFTPHNKIQGELYAIPPPLCLQISNGFYYDESSISSYGTISSQEIFEAFQK